VHNGGCSHICLRSPTAARRRCVCPNVEAMYSLGPDNRTCMLTGKCLPGIICGVSLLLWFQVIHLLELVTINIFSTL